MALALAVAAASQMQKNDHFNSHSLYSGCCCCCFGFHFWLRLVPPWLTSIIIIAIVSFWVCESSNGADLINGCDYSRALFLRSRQTHSHHSVRQTLSETKTKNWNKQKNNNNYLIKTTEPTQTKSLLSNYFCLTFTYKNEHFQESSSKTNCLGIWHWFNIYHLSMFNWCQIAAKHHNTN